MVVCWLVFTIWGLAGVSVVVCISNSTMQLLNYPVIALYYSLWLSSSIAILVGWFMYLVLEIWHGGLLAGFHYIWGLVGVSGSGVYQ